MQHIADTPPSEGATILLVEDEGDIRELVSSYLTELGYHVLTTGDGTEALQCLEVHSEVSLLLTDILLPGGTDGFRLAELARHRRPELKVIYASGYFRSEDLPKWSSQASTMLHKPFRLQQLRHQVEAALSA